MSYIPLIARIDSLPPLPESVVKIETLFAKGDPDIEDIVKVIEKDPSLTANILSQVNAPYYGFSKSIISILQAVTLFGSSKIRSIVLASSIKRTFDVDLSPYNISTAEFAKISAMQSELIFQWYMSIDIDLARNLTPIAFLMETGKILISKEIIETNKVEEFLSDILKYKNISYVETIHTMMTTAQINALIFEHLNLNDTFYECMKYLDNEVEIPSHMKEMVTALQVVRLAINMEEQLSEESINSALVLVKKHSLNIDSFKRAVKRIQHKYFD
ncbi:HDOD domain-containing protein [Sulfurimonas aquatica]|uniref:HDOD domain-containing protein n=1 Tax=Sulfurimonas aquatica TaxID=2672570 RepID=A0A975AYW5_9BACT|nr:HDOD domain-containing protein [Sulfurimonas aquatica]QSZ41043.1 HDOD domain-containing protein [Sulfurimonas aquatica]